MYEILNKNLSICSDRDFLNHKNSQYNEYMYETTNENPSIRSVHNFLIIQILYMTGICKKCFIRIL